MFKVAGVEEPTKRGEGPVSQFACIYEFEHFIDPQDQPEEFARLTPEQQHAMLKIQVSP